MEGATNYREASPRHGTPKKVYDRHSHSRRHGGRQTVSGYGGCCCRCRPSFSSAEETEPDHSEEPDRLSAAIHTMVLEKLEKLISEKEEPAERKGREEKETTSLLACRNRRAKRMVALAVEKASLDPREDLRESMLEMITSNEMKQTGELRRLLECYLSLNSDARAVLVLEVFHEVCSLIFVGSRS